MRIGIPNVLQNYLFARDGTISRKMIYFFAKNRTTGAIEEVGFWNEQYDATLNVVSGQNGQIVSRTYIGTGSLLDIGEIILTSDMSIQRATASLSHINEDVMQAIRGYDLRLAKVEIHYGMLDIDTRKLVTPPYPHFVGLVSKAPIPTLPPGETGSIKANFISRLYELTLTNAAKKSDETHRNRGGDRFRKYNNVAKNWDVVWGEKRSVERSNR